MKLEEIGFYTLSDERAKNSCVSSPLQRCELVLTSRCNFKCPYCRSVGGSDLPFEKALNIVKLWADEGLKNIRFSGGEPTLYKDLHRLVTYAKIRGIERIAVSTNGSARREVYDNLLGCGVNDFSVSLDACCAEDASCMMGVTNGSYWQTVINNIAYLSTRTYTTVGVVLTQDNVGKMGEIIRFADSLGVHDIRIIPAAQDGDKLQSVHVDEALLKKYPILDYRVKNIQNDVPVRGLHEGDAHRCGLVLDDIAVCGDKHYPCIIYMRELGQSIGDVGPDMRKEREEWHKTHDPFADVICRNNCLDVCVQYNRCHAEYH